MGIYMTQYFTDINAGERYASYRPKAHRVLLEWLEQHLPGRRFDRAVDVACGTGDSMIPLQDICNYVIGIDSSSEMLEIALSRGLKVEQSDYLSLANYGQFDLISTCMAFHWFDSAKAFAAYKQASTPGAIWLIYNFAFGGHSTSEEFNGWFHQSYLKEYPSPPRYKSNNVKPEADPEIHLLASGQGWLPIDFTKESLVGYLTTQSNIEEALRQGRPLEEIQASLLRQLDQIDLSGAFKYVFTYEIFECQHSK